MQTFGEAISLGLAAYFLAVFLLVILAWYQLRSYNKVPMITQESKMLQALAKMSDRQKLLLIMALHATSLVILLLLSK